MEIEFEDMIIGYQDNIKFINMVNNQNRPEATFRPMATPDGSSYVIIYQWADPMTKLFSDREEAFYIDNVNDNNKEKAGKIFGEVFNGLMEEYEKDSEQEFQMTDFVNEIINKYKEIKHK